MQKKIMTRVSGIILLMIFSGCGCVKFAQVERCTVSFEFEKCRCHLYDPNIGERVSPAFDFPLKKCNDLTGFSPETWAEELTPKIKYWCRKRGVCP